MLYSITFLKESSRATCSHSDFVQSIHLCSKLDYLSDIHYSLHKSTVCISVGFEGEMQVLHSKQCRVCDITQPVSEMDCWTERFWGDIVGFGNATWLSNLAHTHTEIKFSLERYSHVFLITGLLAPLSPQLRQTSTQRGKPPEQNGFSSWPLHADKHVHIDFIPTKGTNPL